MGLKCFPMETAGNTWVLRIRRQGFANFLAQDKKWFDKGENAGVRLEKMLVRDDAWNLVDYGTRLRGYGDGWELLGDGEGLAVDAGGNGGGSGVFRRYGASGSTGGEM
jgi:hypothetical protein